MGKLPFREIHLDFHTNETIENIGINFHPEEFVKTLDLNDAKIPVVTNVDAKITQNKEDFRAKMPKQISSSVYWVQTIQLMLNEGVDTFIELGNGKVLAGLNRKICPAEVKTYNVFDAQSLNDTVNGILNLV